MRIAKEFTWEMSHRLPYHEGNCKNIHGHSYKLQIALEGEPNENGMLIDFYHIEAIVRPLVNKLDHSFIVDRNDKLMLDFLAGNGFRHFVIDNFTTCENISLFFAEHFKKEFAKFDNIKKIGIRVFETIDTYAEIEVYL